jgi:hypothetical protein
LAEAILPVIHALRSPAFESEGWHLIFRERIATPEPLFIAAGTSNTAGPVFEKTTFTPALA